MQKLLDELEQAGYRDADGTLLTNDRNWHALRGLVARLAPLVKLDPNDGKPNAMTGSDQYYEPSKGFDVGEKS